METTFDPTPKEEAWVILFLRAWRLLMGMNIYVGNLNFNVSGADLETMFTEFGEVVSANLITDQDTGRSRGFGFVEMAESAAAAKAIEALNGKDVDGRALTVNEARPRENRGGGGGRGGGRRF
ncbi:MAG: RNA-binding protein [Planctomycetota bacterium]|nr:RNA-binding protein [Planctomycetota bacterium]